MGKIAVYGAGGFGREVKMLIDQINESKSISSQLEFIGFYDDGLQKGILVNGFPVLGGADDLNKISEDTGLVIAIADPKVKKGIVGNITNEHISYPVLIHPNVYIGNYEVTIGDGTIICAGCLFTVNIRIGKHVIFNLSCTVGHDTVIGDYSSFMPSVNIAGDVNVAECVYVGSGVKIINRSDIGEETTICMGAIVAKSLPAKCTAVGIPAMPIKFHE